MAKRKRNRKTKHLLERIIHENAAGIDIGAEEIVVAIPQDRDEEDPVRTYETFTSSLIEMRDWLLKHKIETVAMESTGVYWITTYDLLEEAGIKVCLVNARHAKGVPGKKTDVCDAQWLQHLHTSGLLKGSFRPRGEILSIRQLMRHRQNLIGESSRHIQRMQKALNEMNLQLHHVFSDIDGQSCMRIIEAILEGERDVETLWALRDHRVRAPKELFLKAMEAHYQPAQLFILKQCQEAWRQTQEAITQCDDELEDFLQQACPKSESDTKKLEATKKHKIKNKNDLNCDITSLAFQYYGVDLTTIDGVSKGALSVLMSEIGTREDFLNNFKTAKHFCSWLGVCPDQKISGGKILSTKTRKVVNRVTEALRLCGFGVGNANNEMGAYARKIKGRLGKVEGITAIAHKLARIIFTMIKTQTAYDPSKAFLPTEYSKAKKMKTLKNLAKSLGVEVIEKQDSTRDYELVI